MKIWWNATGDKIKIILNYWDNIDNHYSLWEIDIKTKNLRLISSVYDFKEVGYASKFETNFIRNPINYMVEKGDLYRIVGANKVKIVDFLGDIGYINGGFTDLKISHSNKYLIARKLGTEIPWFSGNDIIALLFFRCELCVFDTKGAELFATQGEIYYFDLYEP
jgi:hypothetical protein